MNLRPAAFLDRDGTLIVDAHYASANSRIHVVPGAIDAVRRLLAHDVVPVVVTNQSGIARGLITDADYQVVRDHVEALFATGGAPLAATYHCPHHPDISGPCECRKPGLGMYRDAARAHGLDTTRAMFAGDRQRDVEPAVAFGGFGILVPSDDTPEEDQRWCEAHAQVASSLEEAVDRYLHWLRAPR